MENIYRTLRRLFLAFLLILATVTALWQFDFAKKWLHSALAHAIAGQTGWHMTAANIHLAWPLALQGDFVELRREDGSHIEIDHIYCKPSWYSLLKGIVVLDALHLKGIIFTMPNSRQENKKIADKPLESAALREWIPRLTIKDFSIADVHVSNYQQSAWLKGIPSYSLQGSLEADNLRQEIALQVRIKASDSGHGALKATLKNEDAKQIIAQFAYAEEEGCLFGSLLRARKEGCLQIDGTIYSDMTTGYSQISWHSECDEIKEPEWQIGPFSAKGQWEGYLADASWNISCQASDCRLQGSSLGKMSFSISGENKETSLFGQMTANFQTADSSYKAQGDFTVDCVAGSMRAAIKSPLLEYSGGVMRNLLCSLHAQDLFSHSKALIELSSDEVSWQNSSLCRWKVTTSIAAKEKWPYTATCDSLTAVPWQVIAKGDWRASKEHFFASVDELCGSIAGEKIQLLENWQMHAESDILAITPFQCLIGEGILGATFSDAMQGYSATLTYRPSAIDPQHQKAVTKLTLCTSRGKGHAFDIKARLFHPSGQGLLNRFTPYGSQLEGTFYFDGELDPKEKNLQGSLAMESHINGIEVSCGGILVVQGPSLQLNGLLGKVSGHDFAGEALIATDEQTLQAEFSFGMLEKLSQGINSPFYIPMQGEVKIKGPWKSPRIKWKLKNPNLFSLQIDGDGSFNKGIFAGTMEASAILAEQGVTAHTSILYNAEIGSLELNDLHAASLGAQLSAQLTANPEGYTLKLNRGYLELADERLELTTPCELSLSSKTLTLMPLKIALKNGHLLLSGHGDFETIDLQVKGTDISLAGLLHDVLEVPLQGIVSIDGNLRGPWSAPEGSLHVEMRDIEIEDAFLKKTPPCNAVANFDIKKERVLFEGKLHCQSLEPITFQAEVPLALSLMPFKFQVDKRAPIKADVQAAGAISPLLDLLTTDAANAAGYLVATLHLRGSLEEPLMNGQLTLNEGYYETHHTGTVLRNITLKARAEGNDLKIEQLQGRDIRGGHFTAQGNVTLNPAEGFPFNITCQLDRLLLLNLDSAHSSIDGKISFHGNMSGASLEGAIDLQAPRIILPEDLTNNSSTVDVTYINVPPGRSPLYSQQAKSVSLPYPINLNLAIKTGSRLHIDSRVLSSTWHGNVRLTGPLTTPLLNGELQIQQGTYTYSGKPFDLGQGVIAFNGPWDKTSLYIIAKQEIDSIIVEVIMRGLLKNPSVAFRSNPPMSQQEILSYLLFGKGLSEITPYQGNQISRSISNLTQTSSAPNLLDKLRSLVPIPIELGIGRSPSKEGDKVSFQVGLALTPSIHLSLNKNVTDDTNSIAIEAKVIENVKARIETNSDSETQLFLKWKRDF